MLSPSTSGSSFGEIGGSLEVAAIQNYHGLEWLNQMVNVKPVQLGKNTRMSFAKIEEVLKMPNLIEVQKNSYQWFLTEGLKEVFDDVSGITDFNNNLVLDFVDYKLDDKPN